MMLKSTNNVVMRKVFFTMLGGVAQRWFTELPSESIDAFYELAFKFTTHFMRGKNARKTFFIFADNKTKIGRIPHRRPCLIEFRCGKSREKG